MIERSRWALWSCLVWAAFIAAARANGACLPSGDQEPINQLLSQGGPGTTVSLCAGSAHYLTAPIVFTADHQTIETEGYPTDHLRAELVVTGAEQATAIQGDCPDCSYVAVRSLIIDGNRPNLLRIKHGKALVQLGNGVGQVVRDSRLFEPRGWTAIHLREGDRKQCSLAHIHNNVIGPNGEEWDEEYDDRRHKGWRKSVRYGSPVADGVSLACKDSIVENNTIFDCTDGLVVVFNSPGSEIRYNTLYSKTRLVQGAVNLVDIPPWGGDYTNTRVHHNTINAHSRFMRTAIAIGRSSWDDEVNEAIFGGKITDNTLGGANFGYGIVASSCKDFTIMGNVVQPDAVFSGMTSPRCPTNPPNSPPKAFLYNKGSVETSQLQDDFINGEVQFIICIDMPTPDGVPAAARRFRDSPLAIAQREEEDRQQNPDKYRTNDQGVNLHVAEALVSYQMNVVSAMNGLHRRVPKRGIDSLEGTDQQLLREVVTSVSSVEDSRGLLHHHMLDVASGVAALKSKLKEHEQRQRSRIAILQTALSTPITELPVEDDAETLPVAGGWSVWFYGGTLTTAMVWFGVRRLRARRQHAPRKMY